MSGGKLTEAEIRRIGRAIHGEICADAHPSFSCREAAEASTPAVEAILAEREASLRAELLQAFSDYDVEHQLTHNLETVAEHGCPECVLLDLSAIVARGGDGA